MDDVKLFIVVRKDLKMSCGKIAVQVAHASVMAALSSQGTREFKLWLDGGQKKIVAKVQGLEELRQIEEEARKREIPVHEVVDMGLTEVPPGSVTCAALGPAPSSSLDPFTGNLKLL
ncbi:MAG TPA: peptidyl-tRNA hydrolase [Thermoprotei archaeon]|nr:peptidyl-tRNA hydrolase Pth2 [TACK group archaeon]HEV51678.1 peptidyl-tRNA hydrolase [Thermoprotei archaeon]